MSRKGRTTFVRRKCDIGTLRRALLALLTATSLMIALLPEGLLVPATASASGRAPAAATSYYMKTTNPRRVNAMGCGFGSRVVHGTAPADALVVLAFGSPRHRGWRYGASLFGHGFASTGRVRRAGLRFAAGFVHCSRKRPRARLRIALGTSNYGPQVGFFHGRAWAWMVNGANERLAALGYADRIDITGANDIEPGFGPPREARAWVRGYDSVNEWPYYDFGGAAGCPPYGDCQGSWTLEDVWFVAWGAAPALPLPEIYTRSGSSARQWFHVSLYSSVKHGSAMTIAGVVSQRRACDQTPDPCRGMYNSPPRAWRQLSRALNSDRRTAQHLRWVTDMSWTR
jgi:hypothetical protein